MQNRSKNSIAKHAALVRQLVRHHFPKKVIVVKPLSGGLTNFVFAVSAGQERLVVRLSDKPEKIHFFQKEQWAVAQAKKKGIPVPEILEVGNDIIPMPYMISNKIEGEEATHQPGQFAATTEPGQRYFPRPQRGQRFFAADRFATDAGAHLVRVAVRHHHDVAGRERRGLVAHTYIGGAFGDVVELDDARGLHANVGQECARLRGVQGPRGRATRVVEQRAGKFHRAQEFGESVHEQILRQIGQVSEPFWPMDQ